MQEFTGLFLASFIVTPEIIRFNKNITEDRLGQYVTIIRIPDPLVVLLLTDSGTPVQFHRTPVQEMRGDVLDQVEMEMVNDQISTMAHDTYSLHTSNGIMALNLIHKANIETGEGDIPPAVEMNEESLGSLLAIANNVYAKYMTKKMDNFVVGTSQQEITLDDENLSTENDENILEGLSKEEASIAQILMILIEELVFAWQNI